MNVNPSMATNHRVQISGRTAGATYHFLVKSSDAVGNVSGSADYTFNSAVANRAPITEPDVGTTQSATAVTIDVLVNDSDPDGDPLRIRSFTQPANGSIVQVPGGLQYMPNSGYAGTDSFSWWSLMDETERTPPQ
jgi:hypothetical protein